MPPPRSHCATSHRAAPLSSGGVSLSIAECSLSDTNTMDYGGEGMPAKPEVIQLREFLQHYTVEEIRQAVLHRTELGVEFLTLQKKALSLSIRDTSPRESERSISVSRLLGG